MLNKILFKQIDATKIEHYKRIARFYMQAERYEDAIKVLKDMPEAFPDNTELEGTAQAGHRFDSATFRRPLDWRN